ncbi:MAG: AEC family transporter [Lachnospiraceae bacterium]|nr:AEC family transporter [Lachnospiraceae bacterium]MDE7333486.1 AEC family transporter [Lachnospiraceae bacterium]
MLLLQQMVVLFILMGLGYLCSIKSIITDEVGKKLSAIVVNIANPALILTGCMGEEKIQGQELLITAAVMLAVYAALLVLAQLLPWLLRVDRKSCGTYKAMTVFSNIGFMGFPVVSALYGSGALLYAALFMIPYNILIYTYGVSAMAVKEDTDNGKSGVSLGRILNIGVIACILTIVIYLLGLSIPEFIKTTVTQLSNLTAPLSMMIIGASLASIDLRKLFMDGKLLVFSFIKLVIIPAAGVLLIKQFVNSEVICGVCMVMLATPVGSMTAMLAQQYDGDYEMASKGVALTTILSVATMPLVSWMVM